LAAKILKGLPFVGKPGGHHLWLSLPSQWTRSDFISHLLRDGLAVVGGEAFAVGGTAPHAVRVALGAARNRAELSQAMYVLAAALKSTTRAVQIV
jgi:DNA-binding transcriptional MocR family regulator